jgi:hypothetical protein
MTTQTVYKNLKYAYTKIDIAMREAAKASLKYEILMNEKDHASKKSRVIKDVDDYVFSLTNARN